MDKASAQLCIDNDPWCAIGDDCLALGAIFRRATTLVVLVPVVTRSIEARCGIELLVRGPSLRVSIWVGIVCTLVGLRLSEGLVIGDKGCGTRRMVSWYRLLNGHSGSSICRLLGLCVVVVLVAYSIQSALCGVDATEVVLYRKELRVRSILAAKVQDLVEVCRLISASSPRVRPCCRRLGWYSISSRSNSDVALHFS